jgi:hypothetical protein
MKMIKLKFPENMGQHFATWTFNNEIRVQLSYAKDDFFTGTIIAYCAVPAEKEEAIKTEFKNYVQNS